MLLDRRYGHDVEYRKIDSKVNHHLSLLKECPFIKRTFDLEDGHAYVFDGGRMQIGRVESAEFSSLELVEHTLIIRHIWITESNRGRGLGREAMTLVRDMFIDTNVALFLWAIPIEIPVYDAHGCTVIDDPAKQKKLVSFYEELGWVVQDPVNLYVPVMLMEMVGRYEKYSLIPAPMVLAGKKLPKGLKKQIQRDTISGEEWFRECGLS